MRYSKYLSLSCFERSSTPAVMYRTVDYHTVQYIPYHRRILIDFFGFLREANTYSLTNIRKHVRIALTTDTNNLKQQTDPSHQQSVLMQNNNTFLLSNKLLPEPHISYNQYAHHNCNLRSCHFGSY